MFEDLQEKFNSLLRDLKRRVNRLRGQEDDEDDEEVTGEYDVEDNEDEEDKTSAGQDRTEELDADSSEEEGDGEDDDSSGDDSQEKRSKLIKGFLVLAIGYLVLDTFILSGGDKKQAPQKTETPPVAEKTPEKSGQPQQQPPQEPTPPAQAKTPEKAPTPDQMAEAEGKVEETPTPAPTKTPEKAPTPDQMAETEGKVEETPTPTPTETPEKTPTPDQVAEATPTPAPVGEKEKTGEESVAKEEQEQDKDDEQKLEGAISSLEEKVEKQQQENLEYVSPPDYEELGRGLVYNCEGGHWACVGRQSYFACRDNKDWSLQNDENPECYPVAVYASQEDCKVVQLYNINTKAPTNFCSGKTEPKVPGKEAMEQQSNQTKKE